MRINCVLFVLLAISINSFAQSDLELIAFPERNSSDTVIRTGLTKITTEDEHDSGARFEMMEAESTMRYSLSHRENRDIYFNADSYWASTKTSAVFDETGAALPGDLYDIGVGGLYRQDFDNGWTFGARLRVGSASDELFDSTDEAYLRSMFLLRVPHTEYTSWVFMANINTDGDFPIFPGIGYAFPLSRRAYALVGFPILAAGGQLTDKLSFFFSYFPALNIVSRVEYSATERWTVYAGFESWARYFNRAQRDDEDDRIRLQDSRAFIGSSVGLTKRLRLDVKAGYAFDREFGEGDDFDEREDNTIRLDDAAFVTGSLQFRF